MSEFIGSRISLISKSDIRYARIRVLENGRRKLTLYPRYVGRLHEINSADSTVSLEEVRSYGSEGRKGNPEEEIPPSDQVYEYIVFRGSDVKVSSLQWYNTWMSTTDKRPGPYDSRASQGESASCPPTDAKRPCYPWSEYSSTFYNPSPAM